jgi:Flp pilus assembly protein TadG
VRRRDPLTLRIQSLRLPTRKAASNLSRLHGEDGSSLVEFAIIAIVLVTLLVGIAGFGHALYAYHFVSHAAREATRWASVNGSQCANDSSCKASAAASDVQNYVNGIVPPGIDPNKLTVTATWPTVTGICATKSNAPGCTVQVQVSYSFSFIFPLIHTSPVQLSSTSQMIISH